MATPDPRPVTAPPAPDLPDAPPPISPPPVPARVGTSQPVLDDEHLLPAHKGKVGRVTDHVKGAANSLTDWFELRIALLKREVKDEIQTVKDQAAEMGKAYGAVAVLALVSAVVALFVAGFLFSALWGLLLGDEAELWSLTLGFFTLMLLFVIGTLVALRRAKRTQKKLPLFSGDEPAPVTDRHAAPSTP